MGAKVGKGLGPGPQAVRRQGFPNYRLEATAFVPVAGKRGGVGRGFDQAAQRRARPERARLDDDHRPVVPIGRQAVRENRREYFTQPIGRLANTHHPAPAGK